MINNVITVIKNKTTNITQQVKIAFNIFSGCLFNMLYEVILINNIPYVSQMLLSNYNQ